MKSASRDEALQGSEPDGGGDETGRRITEERTMDDTWVVNGKWIAPGRNQREAIDYLKRCGVKFEGEIVLVWKFEG